MRMKLITFAPARGTPNLKSTESALLEIPGMYIFGAYRAITQPMTDAAITLDQAKAIAPLPDFAKKKSAAVEGTRLMTLARKSLSCLRSRVSCAPGTAKRPFISTTSAITLIGSAPSADPSAVAIGVAKKAITSAHIALVTSDTVTMVGAIASMSRSARTRQDV